MEVVIGVMLLWHECCCSALGPLKMISLDHSHPYTLYIYKIWGYSPWKKISLRNITITGFFVILEMELLFTMFSWQPDSHGSYTKALCVFWVVHLNGIFKNYWLLTDNSNFLLIKAWKNSAKQSIASHLIR